ncbi:hypothetical protein LMH87_005868 [Akanthomyces muscarius]|uniref:Uncharacterized protein n=1 Tax=Akanthomyces muscarius TaxID=2231603 RepID=A0A9W8USK8_AKAMU|nr:hypothetical protein LMH87_005868 [Akanthomyces muscarius]KAJ4164184.1 hypothetical protein LMH87_005868 [Akanthomyces muscarius]
MTCGAVVRTGNMVQSLFPRPALVRAGRMLLLQATPDCNAGIKPPLSGRRAMQGLEARCKADRQLASVCGVPGVWSPTLASTISSRPQLCFNNELWKPYQDAFASWPDSIPFCIFPRFTEHVAAGKEEACAGSMRSLQAAQSEVRRCPAQV